MKSSILILCLLVMTSCGVLDRKSPGPVDPSQPVGTERIDYDAIRDYLGLDRPASRLGFEERAFNTCDVGHGYSRSNQCRQRQMGVLHFRLLCRDSTGTVSSVSNMEALANTRLRWEIGNLRGQATTDSQGYGQLSFITRSSQERSRLILHLGGKYVGVRVGDLKMHVLPAPWCQ